jgi:hypothetical protein
MDELINSYKQSNQLHHAYFLVGDGEVILPKLNSFLEKNVGVKITGNPDFWSAKLDTLTIEEARNLAEASERKDFSGSKKIFIIQTDFITLEAQNSLLKVFEEPTFGTHFFIISPQDILLPTLRSRVVTIVESPDLEQSESVLKLKMKERLAKIKEITDAISDEESTKQEAISFLNKIEMDLYKKGAGEKSKELKICEATRAALLDRGAPVKIILENLMLNI